MKMKACPIHKVRFYPYTNLFCEKCGSKAKEIIQCCKDEELSDLGYCWHCGKKKEIKFKEN